MDDLTPLYDALQKASAKTSDPDPLIAAQAKVDATALAGHIKTLQGSSSGRMTFGQSLNDIPRQVGLTARYGMEAAGDTLDFLSSPIRAGLNKVMPPEKNLSSLITGKMPDDRFQPGGFTRLADSIGLPKPRTAEERVIGDSSKMLASAAVPVAAGVQMAKAPGMVGSLGASISAMPVTQGISSAASGAFGGLSREAGGNELQQLGASFVGGMAAPTLAGLAKNIGVRLASVVSPNFVNVDKEIAIALRQEGIDWAGLNSSIKSQLRDEVKYAMTSGAKLDPKAASRFVDSKIANVTLTKGMLSQDPVQVTRETNLMKTGANSGDRGLQVLSQNFNKNTNGLLSNIDSLGALNAKDSFDTGSGLLGVVNRHVDTQKSIIGDLYEQARDSRGRSAELDPHYFSNAANDLLEKANVSSFLPIDIRNKLNLFAKGEAPLSVDAAEQLKTSIFELQRGSNEGNVKTALGKVRQALDETPLLQSRGVNPGNLPAVPGTVPPSASILGQESIDAFNKARSANRKFMSQVESVPALDAALNGNASPDDFVKKFIIGGGAKVADVEGLHSILKSSPEAISSVRSYIAEYLRSAAGSPVTRNSAGDSVADITKFNAHSFNSALESIGKDKLVLFFSPDELNLLRATGRSGALMTSQPAGSAVNNSNSGAMLAAKGFDLLAKLAERVPGANRIITGGISIDQQRRAMNQGAGLLQIPKLSLDHQIGNQAFYGGLLASPVAEGNQ
jgi:hypothetical protein